MADVLFVTVIIAFFAIALALVKACDRIIGPDLVFADPVLADPVEEIAPTPASAPTTPEALAS